MDSPRKAIAVADSYAAGSVCAVGPRRPAAKQAVVFDVPDVFYDATLWRRWLARLVAHMGLSIDYERFYRVWDGRYLGDVNCGRREFTEALQSFLIGWGLTWAQIDEIEAASRGGSHEVVPGLRALPGVVKSVTRLAELKLPLLAWFDAPCGAAESTELLARLGLDKCFAQVLTSFDLERTQPSAECYQAILDAVGLPPDELLYVGHDPAHLAGAHTAGMPTVAFNFRCPATADYYLTRFDDLVALVEGHEPSTDACPARQCPAANDRCDSSTVPGSRR